MKLRDLSFKLREKSIILSLVVLLVFSPLNAEKSQAFWPDFIGNAYGAIMENILQTIKDIQVGAAKQAAVMALQKEMSFLITGRSAGGARFVTDWNAYLVTQPKNTSDIYINDYISQATRGRGSLTSYIPAGSEGVGGGSYTSALAQGAKNITSSQPAKPQVTYTGNPSQMFDSANGFSNMDLYLSGINNPWAFKMNVQQAYQTKLANTQLAAQMKVNGTGGVLPVESNGQTINPAGLVEAQIAKVQNMGVDVLTNAQNLPSIISSVVSATINQAMIQGIGTIQASVHREVANVRSQASAQMNAAVSSGGPGAIYKK